jgi:hypothetical protein
MPRAFALIAPALLLLGAAPAHAAGEVVSESTAMAHDVGEQLAVDALCDAHATVGATSTSVTCKITDGKDKVYAAASKAYPGAVSTVSVSTFTGHPAYVCHSAFAVFADGSVHVSTEICDRVAP